MPLPNGLLNMMFQAPPPKPRNALAELLGSGPAPDLAGQFRLAGGNLLNQQIGPSYVAPQVNPSLGGLLSAGLEMAPGSGDYLAIQDFNRANQEGDRLGATLSAASLVPGIGELAAGAKGLLGAAPMLGAGMKVLKSGNLSKEAEGLAKYYSAREWDSLEDALASIKQRTLEENAKYAGLFPETPISAIDELKFRQIKSKGPWSKGKSVWVIDSPQNPPPPVRILEQPTDINSAPPVDWNGQDLVDAPSGAVPGYISFDQMPPAKGHGIKDGKPNIRGGYSWDELARTQTAPPPAQVKITKSGKVQILDGNHRIAWWNEQGYNEIPALIIDERKK